MGSYIKIDRKILEWEWYRNEHTKNVFLHCLLKANWKDGKFEGKEIPRGSFITSVKKLSIELDLTEDEVKTALKHLIKTGELTKQTTNKYTVITVSNYELYQDVTNQIPNKSTSIAKPLPTIEEEKEREEIKKENKNTSCKSEAETLFENLWRLYPNKKGKGQVSSAAKQRLLKVGYEEMVRAIDRYKTELEKDSDWRKPQNGSTFFNKGYVDYLDANYVPGKNAPKQKKNSFNNFPQREYDGYELEKALLNSQIK